MQKLLNIFYITACFFLGFLLFFVIFHSVYFFNSSVNFLSLLFSGSFQRENSFAPLVNNNFYQKEIVNTNEENKKTTLFFVGDIMLDRGVEKSVFKNFSGDFNMLFNKAAFLKNTDILFGNLEGPVSNKGKDLGNLYSFRMDPNSLDAIYNSGFNILSVSNNHAGDWGKEAFIDTLKRLKEKGIFYVGGGFSLEEAIGPVILEKNGTLFGFLAFSDIGPTWLKVKEDSPGILIADKNIANIIKRAAEKVDFLIVSFHFGEEYKEIHNKRQEFLAHIAIDNGAKIVIGHHPHVIQDTEFYKDGFIAYSLGNFIFDQKFSDKTMRGMLLEVIVSENIIKSVNKKIIKINNFYQPELINIDDY